MSTGFFQQGFEYRTEYDQPITINGNTFEAPVPLKFFVEPDESIGCTDWYIAEVSTDFARGVELPKNEPQTTAVLGWAYKHEADAIQSKWEDWLADRPSKRTRA